MMDDSGQGELDLVVEERAPDRRIQDDPAEIASWALGDAVLAELEIYLDNPGPAQTPRTGQQVRLTADHCSLLARLFNMSHHCDRPVDQIASLGADGQVILGEWHLRKKTGIITAYRGDGAEWLSFALPDGTFVAQRETDLSDPDAVAFGMLVLETWADDPERS